MKYIKLIVIALTSCFMLSGCGIYSSFKSTVDTEVVDSLYNYIEASNDTTNIATIEWRELFKDEHLQVLIERALNNNTDLNVARLSVEQADLALKTARLAYLPSLTANGQGAISSFNGSTSQTYSIALNASWEIDFFGKLRNAKERSKAALEQSIAYQQAVHTQLVATVAGSYYSLLMLDEQLRISERTLENWNENLRVIEAMKNAGRLNETSVLQSEATNVSLRAGIVTIKEQIAAMENTISSLLAIPTEHIERGVLVDSEFSSEISVGVPLQLLSNRPDVRMAESNLAQAFYATAEARSALYPSITLSGSAGFTNSSGVTINPGNMLYSAVASIAQSIFNRGTLRAQVKISESQQEQALLQFNQALLDAGAEVNNALSEWQGAQERLVYGAREVELLASTLSKTELLMKYGSVNYLDILTAQLSLLQAELSYATERYNEAQGVISLYHALGGGK